MNLIGRYSNAGFASVADAVTEFFERRVDLRRPGVAFGPEGDGEPASSRLARIPRLRLEPEGDDLMSKRSMVSLLAFFT